MTESRALQAGKPLETRWANALRRAEKEGIEVRRIEGTEQFVATSHSDPSKVYALQIVESEPVGCSCPSKDWGNFPCKHAGAYKLAHDPGFAARLRREAGQQGVFEGVG